jgi:hypothetical protein
MDPFNIEQLHDELRRLASEPPALQGPYLVPRFVVEPGAGTDLVDVGNPYAFYRDTVAAIVELSKSTDGRAASERRGLDETDVVYLSFVRSSAALNGRIGTALSQLALVPHLRRLGVTVFLALPTGRMGRANRKGSRGSPFAVAGPFGIDPSIADPLLPNLNATVQYQLLVQACQMVNIRCGSIAPSATLALDSPLIARFPEITYWWDLPPGTPLSPSHDTAETSPGSSLSVSRIDPAYARRFTDAPPATTVEPYRRDGVVFWRSSCGLTPATACPDIVPDETGTASWADVVSLRFDDDMVPNLGPVDQAVDDHNRAVQIAALAIAWRAAVLGESVFWVDVAARVPSAVLDLATRLVDVWDDRSAQLCQALDAEHSEGHPDVLIGLLNSVIADARRAPASGKLVFIAEELYQFRTASPLHHAVVGPWIFCVGPFTRDLATLQTSMRHHIGVLAGDIENATSAPLFLAGMGDHDTVPPNPALAVGLLTLSWLLPGGIAMLLSGHEFGSPLVINTEFGFNSTAQLRDWRDALSERGLALFNDGLVPWNDLDPIGDLQPAVRRLLDFRARLRKESLDRLQVVAGPESSASVVAFQRSSLSGDALEVHLNLSSTAQHRINAPHGSQSIYATSAGAQDSSLPVALDPFAAVVFATRELASHLIDGSS